MTAIRIHVTAEHIAAAGAPPADDEVRPPDWKDPVERAIAEATGQDVGCDQDDKIEIATIGSGPTTVVVSLPIEQARWIDSYYRREPVEPFDFDIEIEDWLTALLRTAGIRA